MTQLKHITIIMMILASLYGVYPAQAKSGSFQTVLTAVVSIESGQVSQNGDVTVKVTAAVGAGANLGAATIEVSYDPSVVQVKTCTPDPGGVLNAKQCNPAYAANKLRFNVAATYGLTGTVQLARLTFHSIASSGATDLTILPVAFVDAAGAGISAAPRDGQITILSLSPLVWLPFIAR